MPPRRRSDTGLTVGLVIAGGVVVLLVAVACAVWVSLNAKKQTPPGPSPPATFSREEWDAAFLGKTADEVVAAIGRPDDTSDRPDNTPGSWRYYRRVRNPNTGKADTGVLEFADGKVIGAHWF